MPTKEKRVEMIAVAGVRMFCVSIFLIYSFMMVEMLFFSYEESGHLVVEDPGYQVPWYAVHKTARFRSAEVTVSDRRYNLIAWSDGLYAEDTVRVIAGSVTHKLYFLDGDGYDYRFFRFTTILMLLLSGLMFFRIMSELGVLVILSFLVSLRLLDVLIY